MVEPNPGKASERSSEARNTREVVPIRLSSAERRQIARASERRNIALSAFIREAALAASAFVGGRVTPRPVEAPERVLAVQEERLEEEPQVYFVDGEPVPVSWGKPPPTFAMKIQELPD